MQSRTLSFVQSSPPQAAVVYARNSGISLEGTFWTQLRWQEVVTYMDGKVQKWPSSNGKTGGYRRHFVSIVFFVALAFRLDSIIVCRPGIDGGSKIRMEGKLQISLQLFEHAAGGHGIQNE